MFRRLYWIVEQVAKDGASRVTGTYTSIQDLIHIGLKWSDRIEGHQLRLTLMKPDCFDCDLGQWTSNDVEEMIDALHAYVKTNEYTEAELADLRDAIGKFVASA